MIRRLQHEVLTSALHQFPVIGGDLAQPKRLGGGPVGLVVGIAGSLYGGLGVAQAFQYAANTVWGVPRNNRPNPFKARGRSVLLLATAGLAVLGTTALSIAGGGGAGALGAAGRSLTLAASVVINIAVAIFAFRFAPARRLSVRDVVPGAIAAAVIWQLLQSFGVIYVRHVVEHASATNAVFALVLGLLAFLYITATAVLLCVEINVVRVNRLHPRSLLTPFTDNVTLTPATGARTLARLKPSAARASSTSTSTLTRPQLNQATTIPARNHALFRSAGTWRRPTAPACWTRPAILRDRGQPSGADVAPGAWPRAQPLRIGPGVIHAGFHTSGQGLGEHERGGGVKFAAEQIGGAGRLEAQGPPVLAMGPDLGEFHLAPRLAA